MHWTKLGTLMGPGVSGMRVQPHHALRCAGQSRGWPTSETLRACVGGPLQHSTLSILLRPLAPGMTGILRASPCRAQRCDGQRRIWPTSHILRVCIHGSCRGLYILLRLAVSGPAACRKCTSGARIGARLGMAFDEVPVAAHVVPGVCDEEHQEDQYGTDEGALQDRLAKFRSARIQGSLQLQWVMRVMLAWAGGAQAYSNKPVSVQPSPISTEVVPITASPVADMDTKLPKQKIWMILDQVKMSAGSCQRKVPISNLIRPSRSG